MTTTVRLAVDIGGTFTDAVLEVGPARHTIKVLTTPENPADAFMSSINQLIQKLASHQKTLVSLLMARL